MSDNSTTALIQPVLFESIPSNLEVQVKLEREKEGTLAFVVRDGDGDRLLARSIQRGTIFSLATTGQVIPSALVLEKNVAINPFNRSRAAVYVLYADAALSEDETMARFKSQLDGPGLPPTDGVEMHLQGGLFVPPEITLEEDASFGYPLPMSSEGPDRINACLRSTGSQKLGTLVTHMPGAPSGFQTMTAARGGSSVTFTPATQSGGNHSNLGWGNFHALYSATGPVTVSYTYNDSTYSEVFLAAAILDVTVVTTVPDSNRHPNQPDSPIDLELSWDSSNGFTYADA